MIGTIAAIMIITSVIYCFFTTDIAGVSAAIFQSGTNAVEFCMTTGAVMCLFCGIMKVAEDSGLSKVVSHILSFILDHIVPSQKKSNEIKKAVTMNVSSNLLGLGNAATPYGISATSLLLNHSGNEIDRSVASFIILNTASVQLVPSTIAAIRAANGSPEPFSIVLPVIITQIVSCTVGLILVRLMFGK